MKAAEHIEAHAKRLGYTVLYPDYSYNIGGCFFRFPDAVYIAVNSRWPSPCQKITILQQIMQHDARYNMPGMLGRRPSIATCKFMADLTAYMVFWWRKRYDVIKAYAKHKPLSIPFIPPSLVLMLCFKGLFLLIKSIVELAFNPQPLLTPQIVARHPTFFRVVDWITQPLFTRKGESR